MINTMIKNNLKHVSCNQPLDVSLANNFAVVMVASLVFHLWTLYLHHGALLFQELQISIHQKKM